jgi:hypothetical protein
MSRRRKISRKSVIGNKNKRNGRRSGNRSNRNVMRSGNGSEKNGRKENKKGTEKWYAPWL